MLTVTVTDFNLDFETDAGRVQALKNVNLRLRPGEALGLVGESGSGKSVTSLAIMGLLAPNAHVRSGRIERAPADTIAMIFQDPIASLNPAFTLEQQLCDVLRTRGIRSADELRRRSLELMALVGIPDPEVRLRSYPFQLSGGLAQRFMIALAMAREPRILIADEPTTALDVTIQAQVLSLLRRLQKERGLAYLLISHDMAVVAQNTSRVAVMYAGEIVEEGSTSRVIAEPRHPYTRALLRSLPSRHLSENIARLPSIPGQVPDLRARPQGCAFAERCGDRVAGCEKPQELREEGERAWRCWRS